MAGPQSGPARLAAGFGKARFNPYPVRMAIDIGTGRAVTATVARVDAHASAIKDVLFHTSVPLQLRWREHGMLDPASWPAITNAVRMAHAAASRQAPVVESAAMTSLPLAGGEKALGLWRSEMNLRIHARSQHPTVAKHVRSKLDPVFSRTSVFFEEPRTTDSRQHTERIAFAAAAAAAKSLNPAGLLVLRERGDGIQIVALDRANFQDEASSHFESTAVAHAPAGYGRIITADVPFASASAHMRLVRDIQQRPKATGMSSPNPVTREEYTALREMLRGELAKAIPDWVVERAALDAPIVAYGGNGSVWNIAARAARSVHMGRDRVDTAAQFEYSGLTDVVLAENLPNVRLVVPQLALFCAVCSVLRTPRVEYIPDVAMTYAMLVDDGFWSLGRAAAITADADHDASLDQRVYKPPRERFDPHQVVDGDRHAYKSELATDERLWNGGN